MLEYVDEDVPVVMGSGSEGQPSVVSSLGKLYPLYHLYMRCPMKSIKEFASAFAEKMERTNDPEEQKLIDAIMASMVNWNRLL